MTITLFKDLFLFLFTVNCTCACGQWVPTEAGRGIRSSGAEARGAWELPSMGARSSVLALLEEQMTTESFLQQPPVTFPPHL